MSPAEERSFLKPEDKDRAEKIDRLGEMLVKIFALEQAKLRTYRELWSIYVADCRRLGIRPRSRIEVR